MELKLPNNTTSSTQQHPLLMQLAFLLFLIILSSGFGSGLVQLLGKWWEMDYLSIIGKLVGDTPVSEKDYVRVCLGISQLFTFTIPALLFMIVLAKEDSLLQLKLHKTPLFKTLLLGGLFILLLFPFTQWVYWLNQQIPLPEWAINQEDLINGAIGSLLKVDYSYELVTNLIVIAMLPALGEELIFRGIIQQKLATFWQQPHLAIWATAIIFSSIHLQFQGFFPRLLLGAALGYLFKWTRNLWVPIFAHFVFNASQILVQHFSYTQEQAAFNLEEMEQFPVWVTVLSMGFLYIVYKRVKSEEC